MNIKELFDIVRHCSSLYNNFKFYVSISNRIIPINYIGVRKVISQDLREYCVLSCGNSNIPSEDNSVDDYIITSDQVYKTLVEKINDFCNDTTVIVTFNDRAYSISGYTILLHGGLHLILHKDDNLADIFSNNIYGLYFYQCSDLVESESQNLITLNGEYTIEAYDLNDELLFKVCNVKYIGVSDKLDPVDIGIIKNNTLILHKQVVCRQVIRSNSIPNCICIYLNR